MRIESLRVKNFKALQNVHLPPVLPGQTPNLPGLTVLIGANGSGKTTVFEVFGFLRDALQHNVRQALTRRGGYREVVTRGREGESIEIEIKFRDEGPLVTYLLEVNLKDGAPIVAHEVLRYRRGQHGRPWHFIDFREGQGTAVVNEEEYGTGVDEKREEQRLDSADILAIKGLGQFQRFRVVSAFRTMIENWHVSDFHISEARPSQQAGYAEHLSTTGDNLPLVAQYLKEQHPQEFQRVLQKMVQRVPGVAEVVAKETEDGRVILRFQDGAFKDPFIARHVSDGTIKMFAYLLLLHDPKPHPILCVEEPENQLYPHLLVELAEEFREYATRGGQVFVSTHSPDFLNALKLDEIFTLDKVDGVTEVRRASDDAQLVALYGEGDRPGYLWNQRLLGVSVP